MIAVKLIAKLKGAHVHVKVYVSEDSGGTYAWSGNLVMHEAEYQAFSGTLAQGADVHKLLKFDRVLDSSGPEANDASA